MPRCTIYQKFTSNDQVIITGRQAVILSFGDKFAVIDPANDNVLIDGMTSSFKSLLEERGWLYVHKPE